MWGLLVLCCCIGLTRGAMDPECPCIDASATLLALRKSGLTASLCKADEVIVSAAGEAFCWPKSYGSSVRRAARTLHTRRVHFSRCCARVYIGSLCSRLPVDGRIES